MDVPETRYARSGDLAIAYEVHGAGDHDLLIGGGPFSNIGTVWQFPEVHRFFERLGRFARVIRYDRRDTGLSDPVTEDLTLEAHAQDALSVMDATGSRRPVLIASFDGSRALALLAAMRPERVAGMIALAPTVESTAARSPELVDDLEQSLAELDWPGAIVALGAPAWAADPVRASRLGHYFQTCATPAQFRRAIRMALVSDIREALPLVQAPTLALRPRDMASASAHDVRAFVDLIPGARYLEVPGDAGFIYALDVDLLADVIEEFVTGTRPAPLTNRVLATVLFTDLVDSTRLAASAGDRVWAETLERHFTDTRAAVAEHGGETIKTTGDGVLALFAGPAQGVRCAQRIISDASGRGLDLRVGLHTGEVERSDDDVAGLAVHVAARVMNLAGAGEILVSRTIRDLVIGSELTFTERGEHELKGIPDRWTLYAAT